MFIVAGDSLVQITSEVSFSILNTAIEMCRERGLKKQEQDELIATMIKKPVSQTKYLLKILENIGVIRYEYFQSYKMITMANRDASLPSKPVADKTISLVKDMYIASSGKQPEDHLSVDTMINQIHFGNHSSDMRDKYKAEFEQAIGNEILAVVQEQGGAWISQTDITSIVKEERPDSSRNIVSRILEKLVRGNFLEYKRTGGGYRGGGWSYRLTEHTKPGDYKVAP